MMMKFLAELTVDAGKVGIPKVSANSTIFDQVINTVYLVIGALCVLFIVRGALLYVTHGSEPSQVQQAKDTIIYALAALVGSTLVFTLIGFVVRSVQGGPGQ